MERSALYRRALAPIMCVVGAVGAAAAGVGVMLKVTAAGAFVGYWLGVAALAIACAFVLVRRQALRDSEPFWSPPARRVAQALLPPLIVGLLLGILTFVLSGGEPVGETTGEPMDEAGSLFWLVAFWGMLYGCALHAAGYFVSRGLRLMGWLFIGGGAAILSGLLALNRPGFPELEWTTSHWLMGGLFGLLQLVYGIYLYLTGEEQNEL